MMPTRMPTQNEKPIWDTRTAREYAATARKADWPKLSSPV